MSITTTRAEGPAKSQAIVADVLADHRARAVGRPVDAAPTNLLLITADALRFDCVGAAGNGTIRTPNIDAMAGQGVTFRNAYSASADGAPARRGILTARVPSAGSGSACGAHDSLVGRLEERGYRTAAFGDVPVAAGGNGDFQLRRAAYPDAPHPEADARHIGAAADARGEGRHGTAGIADAVVDWLSSRDQNEPFLAWASFLTPGYPYDPPPPYDTQYQPCHDLLPPSRGSWRSKKILASAGSPSVDPFDARRMTEEGLQRQAARYYGQVTHLDHHIGRILDALERSGVRGRTMVALTSAHGDYLGQHGLHRDRPAVPYDALARVPLIVRAAEGSRATPGSTCAALVSTMDILPTLLGLAGAGLPEGLQGRDVRGAFVEPGSSRTQPVFIEAGPFRAVRTQRYKYIYSRRASDGELYDVLADPYETTDLSADLTEVVRDHHGLLLDWAIDCTVQRPPAPD